MVFGSVGVKSCTAQGCLKVLIRAPVRRRRRREHLHASAWRAPTQVAAVALMDRPAGFTGDVDELL